MSVEIDAINVNTQIRPGERADAIQTDSQQSAGNVINESQGDTIELSENAQMLQQIEQDLASIPEVDTAKVQAIREAIESGTYQIDYDKIADKMIQFDAAMVPVEA